MNVSVRGGGMAAAHRRHDCKLKRPLPVLLGSTQQGKEGSSINSMAAAVRRRSHCVVLLTEVRPCSYVGQRPPRILTYPDASGVPPTRYLPTPHTAQTALVAGLPFFMVTASTFVEAVLSLHFRQNISTPAATVFLLQGVICFRSPFIAISNSSPHFPI